MKKISKYRIDGILGQGGMATVYRAYNEGLDMHLALKVLSDKYLNDKEAIARFLQEARISAKIRHSNIVPIYDVGNDDQGHYFIAMELIDGGTLADKIKKKGTFGSDEAVKILSVVCAALSEAHRREVVHRDITPMNILFDNSEKVYVADFGIARALDIVRLTSSDVMGTPAYMPPERCEGASGDARSDLYSLGIVLYEMLTGSPPFMSNDPVAVAKMHIEKKPDPPKSINPQVPEWLNSVVMRLLEKKPVHRYQTCDELSSALRSPPPPPLPTPIRDTVPALTADRKKWLLIGLQVAAAVTIGVVVIMLKHRENNEINVGANTDGVVPGIILAILVIGSVVTALFVYSMRKRGQRKPVDKEEFGKAILALVSENGSRNEYPIRCAETSLGRDRYCNVVISDSDRLASRLHAKIMATQGGFYLCHLSKTNMTFVNGCAIDNVRLKDGDQIRLGDTVFEFRLFDES